MRRMTKILIWIVLIAGAASLVEFFVFQKNIKQPTPHSQNNISTLPKDEPASTPAAAVSETQPTPSSNSSTDAAPTPITADPLPEKFLLQIPFYSQAPLSQWDSFHEEMCEEASVLNATLFLENKKLTQKEFDAELQQMRRVEQQEISEWKSTTISQVKKMVDIYFDGRIKTKIIENPTVENIETEIAAGHPVIVPLAGREIGNPNFTPPGPVYHMLVVKGYDSQNFITNDVGTRKGDSYPYAKGVILKNMHDWNTQDIHLGAKKVLVLME
jgi:hypothetical protein